MKEWVYIAWADRYHSTYSYIPVTGVELANKEVIRFNLSNNYPNPFNPSTRIEFVIPEEGLVSLIVYDVLGNEVAALVNEELTPGTYKKEFDPTNLSSGIYFYTLKTENFIQTKKMILLK